MKTGQIYIDYLNAKKNFAKTRKYFKSYEEARTWIIRNFERPNYDCIRST